MNQSMYQSIHNNSHKCNCINILNNSYLSAQTTLVQKDIGPTAFISKLDTFL